MKYSKVKATYKELDEIVCDYLGVQPFATGKDEHGHPEATREDLMDTIQYNINHSKDIGEDPRVLALGFQII